MPPATVPVTATGTIPEATLPATAEATVLTTVPIVTLPANYSSTTTSIVSPTNTVASSDNGYRQTGFNATLLLLSAIMLLLILIH